MSIDGDAEVSSHPWWPGSSPVPMPEGCFLRSSGVEYFGMRDGRRVWRSRTEDRYYTWDSLHGEIEAYDKRGRHVAVLDAIRGTTIKTAEPGRKINV